MRDEIDADATLAEAERVRQTVSERSSRWYVRYLSLAGVAIFVLYSLYALPWPEEWIAVGVVWSAFLVAFWAYERSQQVHSRHSHRRVVGALVGYLTTAAVLIGIGWWTFEHPPIWWWPVSAVLVSLPFFVAAYLEHRAGATGDGPGGASR